MTSHDYLSTGCLHGEHGYCQAHTGLSGAKVPATCKFCGAPCRCECHLVDGATKATVTATIRDATLEAFDVEPAAVGIEPFDLVLPRPLPSLPDDFGPLCHPLPLPTLVWGRRGYDPVFQPAGCVTHSWGTVHVKPSCRCPRVTGRRR